MESRVRVGARVQVSPCRVLKEALPPQVSLHSYVCILCTLSLTLLQYPPLHALPMPRPCPAHAPLMPRPCPVHASPMLRPCPPPSQARGLSSAALARLLVLTTREGSMRTMTLSLSPEP